MLGAYQTESTRTARRPRLPGAILMLTLVSLLACGDANDRGSQTPPAPAPEPAETPPAMPETPDVPEPSPSPVATPSPEPPPANASGGDDPLVARGKLVYGQACIACHNVDPTLDGPLGPAIAGSSLALVEARVLRAEYPDGYTPKRNTRAMVALPHLEPDVPALAAYLASLTPSEGS